MRIFVDHARCEGHGLCEEKAPSLFALDDAGDLTYRLEGHDVPAALEPSARSAASSCPVAALKATP
jgi:ferredoxin